MVVILSSQLDSKKQEELTAEIKKLIKKLQGSLEKVDQWGEKNFSYPIKKQLKGFYWQFNFSLPAKEVSKLRKTIKTKENILRYLLLKLDTRKE